MSHCQEESSLRPAPTRGLGPTLCSVTRNGRAEAKLTASLLTALFSPDAGTANTNVRPWPTHLHPSPPLHTCVLCSHCPPPRGVLPSPGVASHPHPPLRSLVQSEHSDSAGSREPPLLGSGVGPVVRPPSRPHPTPPSHHHRPWGAAGDSGDWEPPTETTVLCSWSCLSPALAAADIREVQWSERSLAHALSKQTNKTSA